MKIHPIIKYYIKEITSATVSLFSFQIVFWFFLKSWIWSPHVLSKYELLVSKHAGRLELLMFGRMRNLFPLKIKPVKEAIRDTARCISRASESWANHWQNIFTKSWSGRNSWGESSNVHKGEQDESKSDERWWQKNIFSQLCASYSFILRYYSRIIFASYLNLTKGILAVRARWAACSGPEAIFPLSLTPCHLAMLLAMLVDISRLLWSGRHFPGESELILLIFGLLTYILQTHK